MNKTILISFFFVLFFSCNRSHYEFDNNLSNYKELTLELNDYFIDQKEGELNISDYYTEDFIFILFLQEIKRKEFY